MVFVFCTACCARKGHLLSTHCTDCASAAAAGACGLAWLANVQAAYRYLHLDAVLHAEGQGWSLVHMLRMCMQAKHYCWGVFAYEWFACTDCCTCLPCQQAKNLGAWQAQSVLPCLLGGCGIASRASCSVDRPVRSDPCAFICTADPYLLQRLLRAPACSAAYVASTCVAVVGVVLEELIP